MATRMTIGRCRPRRVNSRLRAAVGIGGVAAALLGGGRSVDWDGFWLVVMSRVGGAIGAAEKWGAICRVPGGGIAMAKQQGRLADTAVGFGVVGRWRVRTRAVAMCALMGLGVAVAHGTAGEVAAIGEAQDFVAKWRSRYRSLGVEVVNYWLRVVQDEKHRIPARAHWTEYAIGTLIMDQGAVLEVPEGIRTLFVGNLVVDRTETATIRFDRTYLEPGETAERVVWLLDGGEDVKGDLVVDGVGSKGADGTQGVGGEPRRGRRGGGGLNVVLNLVRSGNAYDWVADIARGRRFVPGRVLVRARGGDGGKGAAGEWFGQGKKCKWYEVGCKPVNPGWWAPGEGGDGGTGGSIHLRLVWEGPMRTDDASELPNAGSWRENERVDWQSFGQRFGVEVDVRGGNRGLYGDGTQRVEEGGNGGSIALELAPVKWSSEIRRSAP